MIRMTTSLASFALVLAACAPMGDAPPTQGGWGDAPTLDSGAYDLREVEALGLTGAEMLPESARVVQTRLGSSEPVEGRYAETLNIYERPPSGAVVFTMTGLADDSVSAEQHVVEFDLRPDIQVDGRVFAMPRGYGVRHKCARGADPDAWTTGLCP